MWTKVVESGIRQLEVVGNKQLTFEAPVGYETDTGKNEPNEPNPIQ